MAFGAAVALAQGRLTVIADPVLLVAHIGFEKGRLVALAAPQEQQRSAQDHRQTRLSQHASSHCRDRNPASSCAGKGEIILFPSPGSGREVLKG
jgi:hypothetical protein